MNTTSSPECREMLSGISAYLDGELDAMACEAIDRHCQQCASCHAFVEGLKTTAGLCRQAATAPLPDAVRERAQAAIRKLLAAPPAG